MTSRIPDFINITKKNFGKKNDAMALVFFSLFSLLGILGVFLNWQSWVCAAFIVISFSVSWNKINKVLLFFIGGLFLILAGYFRKELGIDIFGLFITLLFFPFIFFIKPYYLEYKNAKDFEVFYLDHKQLRCLTTQENSEYKDYALNPRNYLKRYSFQQIKAVQFHKRHLIIAIDQVLIRPKELTSTDLELIYSYIKLNCPHLLKNEKTIAENFKIENQFYLHKFLIFSPVIVLAPVIYFFGDNGRNVMVSYSCIVLMIICPFVIYKVLNRKS
ncbi:hypothetical protein SAMN05421786_11451 [Chryseobacterium ureilyticum]|uniref:Uncharacterized protein n=1 Tax=Chryseobacterium ureilyticum TaxID=373668 RepID=A0A1N7QQN3_9FLAO|nr:hypothetical protein [Chryseobacterium ureilyticum]SIT25108.1 hypothetical protein SAMN05421786_11451 [Chryseobacterium ureilyticum]